MTGRSAFPPTGAAGSTVPLVLLPGTLCDERVFAPLLARLDPRRPALVVQFDGDDLRQVGRQVLARAPHRFALLGFSLGGIVALEVALGAPERVAGLALVDSNARAWAAVAGDRVPSSPLDTVASAWPSYVVAGRRGDAALRGVVEAMAGAVGPDRFAGQERLVLGRPDRRARLATLTMPALVLAGADDALCPPVVQHEMADRLPDATLALVEDAGHFAPLEAPGAVAAHVATWLERVDRAPMHVQVDRVFHSLQEES